MRVNLLNFSKKKHLIFFDFVVSKKILIKKINHDTYKIDFQNKVQKFLNPLLKPLLSLEKFWSFGAKTNGFTVFYNKYN